jgi:hypothetical protein
VPPPLLVHAVEQLLCFRRKLRPVTGSGHSGKPAAACLPNANSAAAKRKAKLRYALLCRSAAAVRVSFGLIRFAQSRGIAQRVPPCRTAERPVGWAVQTYRTSATSRHHSANLIRFPPNESSSN